MSPSGGCHPGRSAPSVSVPPSDATFVVFCTTQQVALELGDWFELPQEFVTDPFRL